MSSFLTMYSKTAHAKDVHIPKENMNGHPTTQLYKPKPPAPSPDSSSSSTNSSTSATVVGAVTTIKMSVEFVCSASDLYDTLLNPAKVKAWSRSADAVSSLEEGGEIKLFGGNVSGKILELVIYSYFIFC